MENSAVLSVDNITVKFDKTEILRNVSLEMKNGEILSLIGPNGCGKTTFLRTVAGLLPYDGSISINGKQIRSLSRGEIAKRIAMLGQTASVYFTFSVFDCVMMGRYARLSSKIIKTPSYDDKIAAENALEAVGITDLRDRLITTLSGGQLQRVFLARTIAQEPQLILLDEPTNHLDFRYQLELIEYLKEWVRNTGNAVVGVMHDINLAFNLSDDIAVMSEGKLERMPRSDLIKNGRLNELYDVDVRASMNRMLEYWV
jgi:iron complex transport system ATP-binding protein